MEYYMYIAMGIILLPAMIFSFVAQAKVNTNFKKYSKVESNAKKPACVVAREILAKNGINDVIVKKIGGTLTDYYSDREKTVALSQDIYDSDSVSAIGIAMHEVGHAMQYASGYFPIKVRNLMVIVCNISSKLLWPLVFLGLIFDLGVAGGGVIGEVFLWSGIGFFGFSAFLNFVTLPVEYNASARAKKVISSEQLLTEQEKQMASKVLDSAALTYVAALMVSITNLLRFLIVVMSGRKRD